MQQPQQIVLHKALGALHSAQNDHPTWFKLYPRSYVDRVFMHNWQELNHFGNAVGATFKDLRINGVPGSVLKRAELNKDQPFPCTL